MKINRRQLLLGSTACFVKVQLSTDSVRASADGSGGFKQGWHTLPVGGGGLITGFDIAPDGTMVCRVDVYGAYRWSGTTASVANPNDRWVPLFNASLHVGGGCYEIVIAHNRTSRIAMIASNNSRSGNAFAVYISDDGGTNWRNTGLNFNNADGNAPSLQKNASGKIIFDPNNANVCYAGMPKGSGQTFGLYRSTDGGTTFAPVTMIAAPRLDPGVAGMRFDVRPGTTTAFGQTVTKRLLVPVAGIGLYETVDGGQTFTEVGNAALGVVSVFMSQIDFDGVYYVNNTAGTNSGYVWRYSGAGGSWVQLDAQAGWSRGAGWLGNTGLIIADPRNGRQGFVSLSGPNGLGAGFTSHNANSAVPSSITWRGRTGGGNPKTVAPSYDVAWLNHGIQGLNAYLGATYAFIDANGIEWWSGNQGFWFFSDIPDYGASPNTTSNSVTRGIEATVTTGICKPPGYAYPIMHMQDVGVMAPSDPNTYPSAYYVPGWRMDAYNVDFAVTDPTFLVVKADSESNSPHFSAYSTTSGSANSWKQYATMPDRVWELNNPGLASSHGSVGGQIIAIDHDHHICIGQGYNSLLQPVYTTNATSPSCSWSFCSGLPAWRWFNGAFVAPTLGHPFAADYVDVGTVYCVAFDGRSPPVASKIYKSTDNGATWAEVSSQQIGAGGNVTGIYLLATPGRAGHLWLFGRGTSGGGNGLWHSINHGSSWTKITPPAQYLIPYAVSLGAPASPGSYPTLYVAFAYGYPFHAIYWHYSTNEGVTWTRLTGSKDPSGNQPRSCALAGLQSFTADPDVFGRLYFGSHSAGFFYYSP